MVVVSIIIVILSQRLLDRLFYYLALMEDIFHFKLFLNIFLY